MINNHILGLCNLHTKNNIGGLSDDRSLASTSFLCRYAPIDFVLSNFSNSKIDRVGILVNNHPRSILKHLGSMTHWNTNTKLGFENILFNERGALNPNYNHDINNIRFNDFWVFYQKDVQYVVVSPADIIMSIDFRPYIEKHIKSGKKISLIYKEIHDADVAFKNEKVMEIDKNGLVASLKKNKGNKKDAKIYLESFVMNIETLKEIVEKKADQVSSTLGLSDILMELVGTGKFYEANAFEYTGYARCLDSLSHFMEYSFEVLDYDVAESLFKDDWPIYTLTHDTPPASYGPKANVKDCFVANGAYIGGKVNHSIISRGVVVEDGAVVENSIILADTIIGKGVHLDHVIIDKYSSIKNVDEIKGTLEKPVYLKQNAKR